MSDSEHRLEPGDYRQQFADFLDRLANGTVDSDEWSSFVVTHYSDESVEDARRMTAEMACGYTDVKIHSEAGADLLRSWAVQLRGFRDA